MIPEPPTSHSIEQHSQTGAGVLKQILNLGRSMLENLPAPGAWMGTLRGTGPGVSFGSLVGKLESEYPIELYTPFEGSNRVAGGVWSARTILDPGECGALAKLRWADHADDLPMHAHFNSDRCLIVLEGRGFFHVTAQPFESFDGQAVRTIAARERDVFVFSRRVVHTFSTADQSMTLVSCQLPFIDFDSPDQYALPTCRWTARTHLRADTSAIHCPGLVPLI
jgi:mannose-6-phosphate isomerase-like protein (cupin superfamily)